MPRLYAVLRRRRAKCRSPGAPPRQSPAAFGRHAAASRRLNPTWRQVCRRDRGNDGKGFRSTHANHAMKSSRLLAPWAEDRVDGTRDRKRSREAELSELPFATSIPLLRTTTGRRRRICHTCRKPIGNWTTALVRARKAPIPSRARQETVAGAVRYVAGSAAYRASNETVLLVTVGGLAILTLLMVLFYAIFK